MRNAKKNSEQRIQILADLVGEAGIRSTGEIYREMFVLFDFLKSDCL